MAETPAAPALRLEMTGIAGLASRR